MSLECINQIEGLKDVLIKGIIAMDKHGLPGKNASNMSKCANSMATLLGLCLNPVLRIF